MNMVDGTGTTPLHYAVAGNQKEVVNVLLANGANPNIRNKDDLTPCYIAGEAKNYEMLNALVAAGADINAPCEGGTLLNVAAAKTMLNMRRFSFPKRLMSTRLMRSSARP